MKLFRCILLVVFCSFVTSSYAQNVGKDVVHLKDNSKLIGKVKSYDIAGEMVLAIGENEITIPATMIKKVIMDDNSLRLSGIRSKKWYYRANLGLLLNDNGTGASFNHTFYYGLKNWLQVGIGFGIDNYYLNAGRNVWPLYLELKSFLTQGNSAPYLALKGGYGFVFQDTETGQTNTSGGPLISPSIGYRIGSRGMFVDLYAGLRFQSAKYEIQNSWSLSNQSITWKRLELGAALNF